MMTSLAFILGVVPLVLSQGAGAEMRKTLGTAVFSGMLGVTLFGIFLTPVFYFVIQWLSDKRAAAEQRPGARRKLRPTTTARPTRPNSSDFDANGEPGTREGLRQRRSPRPRPRPQERRRALSANPDRSTMEQPARIVATTRST